MMQAQRNVQIHRQRMAGCCQCKTYQAGPHQTGCLRSGLRCAVRSSCQAPVARKQKRAPKACQREAASLLATEAQNRRSGRLVPTGEWRVLRWEYCSIFRTNHLRLPGLLIRGTLPNMACGLQGMPYRWNTMCFTVHVMHCIPNPSGCTFSFLNVSVRVRCRGPILPSSQEPPEDRR